MTHMPAEWMEQAIAKRQEQVLLRRSTEAEVTAANEVDTTSSTIVNEMNEKFAVLEQPTFLILEENEDGSFALDKKQSFKDRFFNQPIDLGKQKKSKAEIFLESPHRRTFRKIVMNPRVVGHYEENGVWFFNLWKGFACAPRQGCCEKFKGHILEVICAGRMDHYEFLMNLLANWIQKPEERTVALLLRGPQGCGKNIFVEAIGKLFGRAFGTYDDVERLLGRFNSELATKILIFADEALWGGRKSDSGKLKAAITGESIWIEQKGKDKIEIPNYRKFIAASNERFALPLDSDDRRWLVLDCSGHRVRDAKYFAEISEELADGGYSALLHELQHRKLTDFKPRILPVNDDAFDLKLQSAPSFIQYLHAVLSHERADLSSSGGILWTAEGMVIRVDVFRDHYKDFCAKEKLVLQGERQTGWLLRDVFAGASFKRLRKRYEGLRLPTYTFPPLAESRKRLAAYFRISDIETIFPEDEDEVS